MEKLYTCKEVAERYRVCEKTVYTWIKTGQLNAIQVGSRKYRIRQEDLDIFDTLCSTSPGGAKGTL